MERRGDVRTRVLFDTLYSAGRTEGEVTLTDVSSSGALVEGASEFPPIGTDVRLLVLPPGEETVELSGVVVRHTDSGFAIRFKQPSEEILRLLVEFEDREIQ